MQVLDSLSRAAHMRRLVGQLATLEARLRLGVGPARIEKQHQAAKLTAERVKTYLGDLVLGPVERFCLPNLGALNFLLHRSLGRTVNLQTDAPGKTYGPALLNMEWETGEL